MLSLWCGIVQYIAFKCVSCVLSVFSVCCGVVVRKGRDRGLYGLFFGENAVCILIKGCKDLADWLQMAIFAASYANVYVLCRDSWNIIRETICHYPNNPCFMSVVKNKYRFFMQRYVAEGSSLSETSVKEEGSTDIYARSFKLSSDGAVRDLERDFAGLRYKSASGLNGYGNPRVYEESFADADGAEVYVPDSGQLEQTEVTLTLYFFGENMGNDGVDGDALYAEADTSYHAFMDFLRGAYVVYFDNARKRKVLLYLSSATSPKTDSLKGCVYKEVEFKFKNIFGRSFALDDATVKPVVTTTAMGKY